MLFAELVYDSWWVGLVVGWHDLAGGVTVGYWSLT